MKVIFTAINSKYIHTALGLRYISEYCKSQGHDVTLIEETINTQLLTILEKLMSAEADVFAFSVHIWNKPVVYKLISMLKKLCPQAVIIAGGPEVAFDAAKIFAEQPAIDYIVQGEGELVVAKLLQALQDNTAVPQHVAYIENGNVNLNGGVTVIEDLAALPFPYPDLQQVIAEHKIVYYECSRGCPFNCSYCLSGISRSVRRRPLEMVLADLQCFIEAKTPLVKLVDRTYNLDEEYFLPIMEYLAAADTDTTFHFEIKADLITPKVLDFLKNVPQGRFQLEIGIQTTNPPTLKAINRRDNWEKLAYNVQEILQAGNMHIHLDLIAGLPYEGIKEYEKSFNDVYALQPQMLQLGFLKVLPGTQMSRETDCHKLIYMDEPPYEILATAYIPYKEMQMLKRLENVFEQVYNSGCFANTLRLLTAKEASAFEFYRRLTEWWVKNGHYPQVHNSRGTAKILYDYIDEHINEETVKTNLIEVLRYDVFMNIDGWRPEWLRWNSEVIFEKVSDFWRNEEAVREYLPDYKFSSWQKIRKYYPIELFCYNPEDGSQEAIYVLRDLNNKKDYRIKI